VVEGFRRDDYSICRVGIDLLPERLDTMCVSRWYRLAQNGVNQPCVITAAAHACLWNEIAEALESLAIFLQEQLDSRCAGLGLTCMKKDSSHLLIWVNTVSTLLCASLKSLKSRGET
jgi:hypothetical protein